MELLTQFVQADAPTLERGSEGKRTLPRWSVGTRTRGLGGSVGARNLLLFSLAFLYFASISLLRPTPWLDLGTEYTFAMSLAWALTPLVIGFIINTPPAITGGFLLAMLGPYHRTAIIIAFITGTAMLIQAVRVRGWSLPSLVREGVRERGFLFLLVPAAYMLVLWLLRLGDSTDGWSFLALSASLFTVPFAVYSLSYLPWDREKTDRAVKTAGIILAAQLCIVLAYPAFTGQFAQYSQAFYGVQKALQSARMPINVLDWVNPDSNFGTLRSSHFMSVVMYFLACASFAYAVISGRRKYYFVTAFAGLACLMGENAHFLPGAVAGTAVLVVLLRVKHSGARRVAVSLMIFAAFSTVLVWWMVYGPAGRFPETAKAKVYIASFEHAAQHPLRAIFGEGPAAFSSHAARKRLGGGLSDENRFPFILQFTNPWYAAVLMSAEPAYAGTTLGRPISGILGILLEWGLLGTLILLAVSWKLLSVLVRTVLSPTSVSSKAAAITALAGIIAVVPTLVFRPYLEYPDVVGVLGIAVMVGIANNG